MSEKTYFHRFASPVGSLLLLSDGEALTGLYTPRNGEPQSPASEFIEEEAPFREVARQLDRYFAGELTTFDVPLKLTGTPFQKAVWSELLTIPHGVTISYRELALRIQCPGAVRAVGAANGKNPVGIIVPCHRVIGAAGDLVGYAGGLDCKLWILSHEGALSNTATAKKSLQMELYGSWTARAVAATR
jgi:methylated-DNA-[protein]-cysteine S-methyltransferase